MPQVGTKHFPYTTRGKLAAAKAKKAMDRKKPTPAKKGK